jgi:anti-sigma regulatory factor (Ser/Thr protein kinase)
MTGSPRHMHLVRPDVVTDKLTEVAEMTIGLDSRAPEAARTAVDRCLRERLVAPDLHDARLLVSELVSNSVRYSGRSGAEQVVVSVELAREWFRIGVEDRGSAAVVATRPADLDPRGPVERWGIERVAGGGTQVWAQLPRCPPPARG